MRYGILTAAVIALAGCSKIDDPETPDGAPAGSDPIVTVNAEGDSDRAARKRLEKPAGCIGAETVIFHCKIESGEHLSVCGTQNGSMRSAEYRFEGDTKSIVLAGGEFAAVPYSGGGEGQIAFNNGAVRYIVFSRMVRTNFEPGEPNNPAISDGVLIERGGRFAGLRKCDDPDIMPIQDDTAQKYMDMRDELFTDETIRAD